MRRPSCPRSAALWSSRRPLRIHSDHQRSPMDCAMQASSHSRFARPSVAMPGNANSPATWSASPGRHRPQSRCPLSLQPARRNQFLPVAAGIFHGLANGMIAGDVCNDIRIRHSGNVVGMSSRGSFTVLDNLNDVTERIGTPRAPLLPDEQANPPMPPLVWAARRRRSR